MKYRSTLKTIGLFHLEFRKAATLYLDGCSLAEIRKKALEENIFQQTTENRKMEVFSEIKKRLKTLDEFLIKKVVEGDLETSRQISVYSILKTDRLFFDFMFEVYREKLIIGDLFLEDKDLEAFLYGKAEQAENMAKWSGTTFKKMVRVYKKILEDTGFAKKDKGRLEITQPILDQDIAEHLKSGGNGKYLKAMMGEM